MAVPNGTRDQDRAGRKESFAMKAMGLLLAAVLVSLLVSIPSSADLPLKAPAGWKAEQQDATIALTPGDVPEGKVYAVVVTPVLGKAGTLD